VASTPLQDQDADFPLCMVWPMTYIFSVIARPYMQHANAILMPVYWCFYCDFQQNIALFCTLSDFVLLLLFADASCLPQLRSIFTRDSMLYSKYMPRQFRLSVRPFVCQSHACFVSKRRNASSKFFHYLIDPSF